MTSKDALHYWYINIQEVFKAFYIYKKALNSGALCSAIQRFQIKMHVFSLIVCPHLVVCRLIKWVPTTVLHGSASGRRKRLIIISTAAWAISSVATWTADMLG